MTHSRMLKTLLVAAGLGLIAAPSARAQMGERKMGKIKKMGKHKKLSKEEAKRMTKADTITATDVRKSQARLKKLAGQKERVIRQQIRIMENNLKLSDDQDPKYPDYLFRVAEHYNAMRMNQWKAAMAMHEHIFKAKDKGDKALARRLKKRQKLLFRRSEWWLRKSLQKYILITNNEKFKNYNRMDEVIFTVGDIAKSLAEQAGKRKDHAKKRAYQQVMLVQFSRLTKEFPRSRFIPDALLAKAEYFFHNRKMVEAIQIYQRVARFKGTPLAPYAEYKIGWCYLNLKQHRKALRQFVQVAKGNRGGKNLIRAARKDVVRAYTHIGRPEKGYNFFLNVAKGKPQIAKKMYILLGTMYYAQGKNVECIKVFKDAWKTRWPRDKDRCNWVTSIVDATINLGVKSAQVKAVQWLGQVTTSLTKQLGRKAPQVKQCRSSSENTMKMLATQWHAEGLKTKNMETLKLTRDLYEEYLKTYPKSPVYYLMSYQYADLLWFFNTKNKDTTREEWIKLANLFTKIVKLKKPKKLARKDYVEKRNDAALAAVRCWMKANKVTNKQLTGYSKKNTKKNRKCVKRRRRRCQKWVASFEKKEIPAAELSMLDAFNTYLKYVPKSKYRPAIAFNTGHIYWRYNHFSKAVPLFLKVALEHQGDMPKAARTAAFRVIGMLKVQKKYKAMRKYIDKFIAAKKLMEDEVFKAKMHDFKLKAMWADADRLMKKKKWTECGTAFEEMARKFPGGSNIDTFYWNAGTCYEAAGMLGPAVSMRRKIVRKYPKSKHHALAMYYMAGNYHNLAFFKDAAKWYEKFFKTHKKHKEAANALMWAIVLRGGLGDERRMMRNASDFIQRYKYGKKKKSAKAFWLVVKMYENQGDEDKFLINLSRYARTYGAVGDVDKAIEAYARLGAIFWRQSCKVKMTDGQCIRVSYVRRKGKKKKQKVVIYLERDRRKVNTAKRYFAKALRVWRGGRGLKRIPKNLPKGQRMEMINNARHYAAHAKFMQAEFKFEDYLKLRIPRKLDFNPRYPRKAKRSMKRFGNWLKTKLKAGGRLIKDFMAVVTKVRVQIKGKRRGDPHWSIAAVARTGMVFHNFADLLLNASIPKFLRGFAAKDAYRAQMEKFANPLLAKAQVRYKICLKLSNDLRWFNEWSRLCELEINRLEPDKYPLANERRARPGYLSTTIDKADFKVEAK